ncbi:unnamed protein product, partial [Polarella glacialis]
TLRASALCEDDNLKLRGLDDAYRMVFIYTILAGFYIAMLSWGGDAAHTDNLAFGGPRPVYTLRYVEWSIVVPVLIAIGSDTDPFGPDYKQVDVSRVGHMSGAEIRDMTDASLNQQDTVSNQTSPMPVGVLHTVYDTLVTSPLVASARCTAVYIWVSWLALVIDDELMRWVLVCFAFLGYAVASIEQAAMLMHMSGKAGNKARAILICFQILLFGFYGVIYLCASFGTISISTEQALYTYSDIVAKILHSILLVGVRHVEDLLRVLDLNLASSAIANDLIRMIEEANAPIFTVDPRYNITTWNHKIAEMTGLSAEEATGKQVLDLVLQKDSCHRHTTKLLKDAMDGKHPVAQEIQFKSSVFGEQALCAIISATPRTNKNGEVTGISCVGQDMREYKRQKQELQFVAEDLERLIESANAPILGVDLDCRVVEWNDWVAKRSGRSKTEVVGLKIESLVTASTKKVVTSVLRSACLGKDTATFEIQFLGKDGDSCGSVLLLNATPRQGREGKIVGVSCIGQDITSIRNLDERKANMM